MARALAALFDPLVAWAAPRYRAAVGAELARHGLRYEDLYDPQLDGDVAEALRRTPQAALDARNQRLKRGIDLSMKHSELPPEMRARQTPFEEYLAPALAQVRAERAERAALGAGSHVERTIP